MPKKITETSKPKAKATQTKSTPAAFKSAKQQTIEKSVKPQKTDKTTEVVKNPENKKASKRKILLVIMAFSLLICKILNELPSYRQS